MAESVFTLFRYKNVWNFSVFLFYCRKRLSKSMFNKSLLHIRSESRIPVKIKRPDFRPAGYPVQPQFYGHFLIRNYFGRGRSRTFRSAQDPTFRRKTVALKTTFTKIVDNTVWVLSSEHIWILNFQLFATRDEVVEINYTIFINVVPLQLKTEPNFAPGNQKLGADQLHYHLF